MPEYDVAVIGGGPAGIAAATQSHLYGYKTVLIEKASLGGRLNLARRITNFPLVGISGFSGLELTTKLVEAINVDGVIKFFSECDEVSVSNSNFIVVTAKQALTTSAVIVATGCQPRVWQMPGSRKAVDAGRLFYSWRCMQSVVAGKKVFIVGGGEVAFDQACSLMECGASVTMLIRGDKPRAFPGLVGEAYELGLMVITEVEVTNMGLPCEGVYLMMKHKGKVLEMCFDYGLVAIGTIASEPPIALLAQARAGKGLFFAGDVNNPWYRQAVIAYGDGIRKAMLINQYLTQEGGL